MGNPFCEAKSELKYFEAALAGAVTIASATGPFRRAIRHRETGFIAETMHDWYDSLSALIGDRHLRERVATAAHRHVLWRFGPERRAESMASVLALLNGGRNAARAISTTLRDMEARFAEASISQHDAVFVSDRLVASDVTVVVSLENSEPFVNGALDSIHAQDVFDIDLIIIDDCSGDQSLATALDWTRSRAVRFGRVGVFKNRSKSGRAMTRNLGFDLSDTPFVLSLATLNPLWQGLLSRCLESIKSSGAAFAYPVPQLRGESFARSFSFDLLRSPDYRNDAPALVAKAAWLMVGGYDCTVGEGQEDSNFWLKFASRGLLGAQVACGPYV
ncbi:MAG: glycosyltransferase [Acidobacteriaceae bacterium]|nr:glycosyltransferase [Acidobacteriaceae bacterium]